MYNHDALYQLLQKYAYQHHPEGIKLASGRISQHYFNTKEVLCRRAGGVAAVVDDPPITGESVARTCEELVRLGFPPAKILRMSSRYKLVLSRT